MVKLNTIGGMVATVAVGVALVQGCISAPEADRVRLDCHSKLPQ